MVTKLYSGRLVSSIRRAQSSGWGGPNTPVWVRISVPPGPTVAGRKLAAHGVKWQRPMSTEASTSVRAGLVGGLSIRIAPAS